MKTVLFATGAAAVVGLIGGAPNGPAETVAPTPGPESTVNVEDVAVDRCAIPTAASVQGPRNAELLALQIAC